MTIQSEVASHFSDFGASPEDERDVAADCTVGEAVHLAAEAGILSEVDVSHPMVAFRPTNDRGSMQAIFPVCPGPLELK